MCWLILFLAGLFEIAWAIGLKYSEGFTKLTPSIITIITMFISFYLLSLALKSLPLGTAYAIWVGIGTIGTVIAGIFLFGESMNLILREGFKSTKGKQCFIASHARTFSACYDDASQRNHHKSLGSAIFPITALAAATAELAR